MVRSRPRIADPHIRTVSFPAESTARLACEAQGEPKPTITWTKVATGIHSAADMHIFISAHTQMHIFETKHKGLTFRVKVMEFHRHISRPGKFME